MYERLAKQPLHACLVHKQILVGRHERRVPATTTANERQALLAAGLARDRLADRLALL